MIIPENVVNAARNSSLELSDLYNNIKGHLERACQLLETIAYPCQDFLKYQDECQAHLDEAASLIQGQFSNLAPAIDKSFRDCFDSIATTRDYATVDRDLLEKNVIKVTWPNGAPPIFCPARFIYRHEQEGGLDTIEIINSLTWTPEDGAAIGDVGFIFNNTIFTRDIIEERGNTAPYDRALDVVAPLLRDINELMPQIFQIKELLVNSDLAAFHAGNGADDPVIRDRVGKCMALYTVNLCALSDKVKACTTECMSQAYLMEPMRVTSQAVDHAWNTYVEFVGGAQF